MRTITARFTFPDGSTATSTVSFETLPGTGSVKWEGNTTAILASLPPPWNIELSPRGYAETFEEAMRGLAERCGASLVITSTGTWKVYSE